jgi:RNA polymerase sigma-70 factor (ECF subfamily)
LVKSEPADREHLERIRRGDSAGAAALFDKYSAPLLRFASRMLGREAEAEEVVQDVFLKAITRVEQYDGSAPVGSWLFAIAANACRDRLRRTRRARVVPIDGIAEPGDDTEHADDRLIGEERRSLVRAALSYLTQEQREALVLARYHEMPYAEIARTLGISEGAVKTRVFRALETLRTRLTQGETRWTAATP